jgi:hypothetical protein
MRCTLYATVSLSLAVCFAPWRAGAQDSSSGAVQSTLARSRSVIAEELAKSGANGKSDRIERITLISLRRCEMRYRKESVATGVASDATVSLSELDPERVLVGSDGRMVWFTVKGGARKIRLTPLPGVNEAAASAGEATSERRRIEVGIPSTAGSDFFRVRNRESAERLQGALEQAIKACQGKP